MTFLAVQLLAACRSELVRSVPEVMTGVRGRDVQLITHGFNVNQMDGLQRLSDWAKLLNIGNSVAVGILWPGRRAMDPRRGLPSRR
jgi:hypothetical protein